MFSSKLEIISHFDNLIQQVDIDIEECLKKYNQEQVLGNLSYFKAQKRNYDIIKIQMDFFDDSSSESSESYQGTDFYSESTKLVDYLNRIRMRIIDELRKAQEDTLEEYKLNKTSNSQQNDELKSQTFSPDKFYFQVLFKPWDKPYWLFKLFTFVTDFYISQSDINILEKFINASEDDLEIFTQNSKIIFDEKMVLIGLLQKYFFENLQNEKYPSNVIRVCKQDILNIKHITFYYNIGEVNLTDSSSIDLSNLESLYLSLKSRSQAIVNIEGLSSLQTLHLMHFSPEQISLNRLNSLRDLSLLYPFKITKLDHLFEYLPNIEKLSISSELSYIDLNSLVNLKTLEVKINPILELNFDLFKNLSHQLEEIVIFGRLKEISYETIEKLLFGHQFPYVTNLTVYYCKLNKMIENKLLASFPILQTLSISNFGIRIIDNDAFSNMKQLISLDLSSNNIESISQCHFSDLINLKILKLNSNRIERIDENVFSSLKNLRFLYLSSNQLTSLDPKLFACLGNLISLKLSDNKLSYFDLDIVDYIREIVAIDLSGNQIVNKEEILNRFNGSKIKVVF